MPNSNKIQPIDLSPAPNYTNFDSTANNYFNRRMALNRQQKKQSIQKHGHTTFYHSRSCFQHAGVQSKIL